MSHERAPLGKCSLGKGNSVEGFCAVWALKTLSIRALRSAAFEKEARVERGFDVKR